jgi:hypothetical protein
LDGVKAITPMCTGMPTHFALRSSGYPEKSFVVGRGEGTWTSGCNQVLKASKTRLTEALCGCSGSDSLPFLLQVRDGQLLPATAAVRIPDNPAQGGASGGDIPEGVLS